MLKGLRSGIDHNIANYTSRRQSGFYPRCLHYSDIGVLYITHIKLTVTVVYQRHKDNSITLSAVAKCVIITFIQVVNNNNIQYFHQCNTNTWKLTERNDNGFETEDLITNLLGCHKEALQFLTDSLVLRFVLMLSAELDGLLPCQALSGKQLLSLQTLGLTWFTERNKVTFVTPTDSVLFGCGAVLIQLGLSYLIICF